MPDEVREDDDARLGVVDELGVGVFLLEVCPRHEGHLRVILGLDAVHQVRGARRMMRINGRRLPLPLRLRLRLRGSGLVREYQLIGIMEVRELPTFAFVLDEELHDGRAVLVVPPSPRPRRLP